MALLVPILSLAWRPVSRGLRHDGSYSVTWTFVVSEPAAAAAGFTVSTPSR